MMLHDYVLEGSGFLNLGIWTLTLNLLDCIIVFSVIVCLKVLVSQLDEQGSFAFLL